MVSSPHWGTSTPIRYCVEVRSMSAAQHEVVSCIGDREIEDRRMVLTSAPRIGHVVMQHIWTTQAVPLVSAVCLLLCLCLSDTASKPVSVTV